MEAWLVGGTSDKIISASVYRNDPPSPPLIVGQSHHVSGGAGKRHSDFMEPVFGFPDDSAAVEIHQPTQLKLNQKRRSSRGIFEHFVVLLQ